MRVAQTVVRSASVSHYVPSQTEMLEAEASKFLVQAGFRPDGRPKSERSVSVRAISTPCGGKTAWKRDK